MTPDNPRWGSFVDMLCSTHGSTGLVCWPDGNGAIYGPGTTWYVVRCLVHHDPRPFDSYLGMGGHDHRIYSPERFSGHVSVDSMMTLDPTSKWDLSRLNHAELEELAVALDAQFSRGAGVK